MAEDVVVIEGTVEELKGHSFFMVKLQEGEEVLAKVAGRARRITKDIFPGVVVKVELSPYDLSMGRIVDLA